MTRMDWDRVNRENRGRSNVDSIPSSATAEGHIAKLKSLKNKDVRPLPTLDPELHQIIKRRQAAREAVETARRRVHKLARQPVSQKARPEVERLCREAIKILNGPDMASEYRPSVDSKLRYFMRKLETIQAD